MHIRSNERIIALLQELASRNPDGLLVPEVVVEEARPKSSILHKFFCWDDDEAARQYRIFQARQLIRTTVRYIQVNGDKRPVRVFVSLSSDREEEGGGYRDIVSVLANRDTKELMLKDALRELAVFEQKYAHLKELAEVFAASKAARTKLQKAWVV